MFKDNEESKPISIIITTLSARAYRGEGDIVWHWPISEHNGSLY